MRAAIRKVADQVAEGQTRRLDVGAVRSLRTPADAAAPIGPRWLLAGYLQRRGAIEAHVEEGPPDPSPGAPGSPPN